MKTTYIFSKKKWIKRHRYAWSHGWVIECKCGIELWEMDCHPLTSNPEAYPNEPCKKCEKL